MSKHPIKAKGLLFDTTLCIGCGSCYFACKEKNELEEAEGDLLEDRLSANTYTSLQEVDGTYVRQMCMHCQDPTCVSVCPVGALRKTEQGPVIYEESRCMGCRYCMQACPFSIPKYEWTSRQPSIRKCTMCADRLAEGRPTACSEACPTEATLFGERDELIQIAKNRIAADPDTYHDQIYGLDEVGGTSILIISDRPIEELGFPTHLGSEPLPYLTEQVLSKIPTVTVFGSVLLSGIWWITNRREEVRRKEGRA